MHSLCCSHLCSHLCKSDKSQRARPALSRITFGFSKRKTDYETLTKWIVQNARWCLYNQRSEKCCGNAPKLHANWICRNGNERAGFAVRHEVDSPPRRSSVDKHFHLCNSPVSEVWTTASATLPLSCAKMFTSISRERHEWAFAPSIGRQTSKHGARIKQAAPSAYENGAARWKLNPIAWKLNEEARSRLYRRRFFQVNIRWQALDEIYKIYILLHRSDLKNSAKNRQHFFANG